MHSYKAGWRLVNQYSVCFHGCAVGAKALGRQPRCCLSMNSVIESGRVHTVPKGSRQVKSSQVEFKMAKTMEEDLLWCPSLARAIGRADLRATGSTGKPRVGASSPSSCS